MDSAERVKLSGKVLKGTTFRDGINSGLFKEDPTSWPFKKKPLTRGLFKEGAPVRHVLKVAPFSLRFLIAAVTTNTVVYPLPIGNLPI
jgi:hypothetical protein